MIKFNNSKNIHGHIHILHMFHDVKCLDVFIGQQKTLIIYRYNTQPSSYDAVLVSAHMLLKKMDGGSLHEFEIRANKLERSFNNF